MILLGVPKDRKAIINPSTEPNFLIFSAHGDTRGSGKYFDVCYLDSELSIRPNPPILFENKKTPKLSNATRDKLKTPEHTFFFFL